MRKKIIGWVLIMMCFVASSKAADLVVLPNGMQVLVQEDFRFPLVSVRLFVRTGSAYEAPKQAGISHLLEHMVFKGTKKRGPGEIAKTIESLGGYLNAATSFDYTVFVMDMPASHWKTSFDVLEDMIFGSVFDPKALESEKSVVLAELERGEDSPGQKLFKMVQEGVFEGTPYARPIIGYKKTVRSITSNDLKNYIASHYQPSNMLLVVCGNVKTKEVVEEAEQYFGALRNVKSEQLYLSCLDSKIKGPVVEVQKGPWNKIYLDVAFPTTSLHNKDSIALDILAYILGGDKSSILYKKFKYETGLVDDISCSNLSLNRTGALYFSITLDPDKLDEFWTKFINFLFNFDWKEISKEKIEEAKLNMENDLFEAKETLGGMAYKLGYFQFFEGNFLAEQGYLNGIKALNKQELKNVFRKYILPSRLYAGLLLPKEVDITAQDLQQKIILSKEKQGQSNFNLRQEGTKYIDLGNNRALFVEYDPTLPYTAVTIAWRGGDALLSKENQGLAELTARCLLRGTKKFSFLQLQEFLAKHTSDIDATAGRTSFFIKSKFPSKYSRDMFSLLKQIILEPSFLASEVTKSVREQISDIEEKKDQPLGLLFRELFPFLFKAGPYSLYHLGVETKVSKFSAADVKNFWQQQKEYPFVISVCGQVDEKSLDEFVNSLKRSLSPKRDLKVNAVWGKQDKLDLTLEGRNQSHILLIFPVAGLKSKDTPSLIVLNKALSGQSGILFRTLRDKQGLGYTVTSFLWQTPRLGLFAFYIGTYKGLEKKALDGFYATIEELKEKGISDEDLKRAQNVYEGNYYRDKQALLSRAREKAELWVNGLNVNFNENMVNKIKTVSQKEIKEIVEKYLKKEDSYLVEVKP